MIGNIGAGVLIQTMGVFAVNTRRSELGDAPYLRWRKWADAGGLISAVERTGTRLGDAWMRAKFTEARLEAESDS